MFGKLFNKIGNIVFHGKSEEDEKSVKTDCSCCHDEPKAETIKKTEVKKTKTKTEEVKIVERTCPECGKTFMVKENFAKTFCSEQCRLKSKSRRRTEKNRKEPTTVICKHCGKEFVKTAKLHKYCSIECKEAYYKEHGLVDINTKKLSFQNREPMTKKCEHCGKEFQTTRYGCGRTEQKFCSTECRKASHRRYDRSEAITAEVKCPQCGKLFVRNTASQKFCSEKCRYTYKRLNRKNNSAENSVGHIEVHAKCVLCGKDFIRRMNGAGNFKPRFCTNEHRMIFDAIRQRLKRRGEQTSDENIVKYYNEVYSKETTQETVVVDGKTLYKHVCKKCGKEFTSKSIVAYYCSDYCRESSRYEKRRVSGSAYKNHYKPVGPIEKKCEWCGKTFVAKSNSAKVCSSECAKLSRKAHDFSGKKNISFEEYKAYVNGLSGGNIISSKFVDMYNTMITAKCEHCGKEFEYKLHSKNFQRYCSKDCKREHSMNIRKERERAFANGNGDAVRERQYIKERLKYIETQATEKREEKFAELVERFKDNKELPKLIKKARKNSEMYDELRNNNKKDVVMLKRAWLRRANVREAASFFRAELQKRAANAKKDEKERKLIQQQTAKAERIANTAENRRKQYEKWRDAHAAEIEAKRQDTLRRKAEKREKVLANRKKFVEEDAKKRLTIINELKKKGFKVLYTKCEECGADIPYIENDGTIDGETANKIRFKRFCNKYCSQDYYTKHGSLGAEGNALVQITTYNRGNHASVGSAIVKQKNVERYLMGHSWLAEKDEPEDEENLIKTYADRADRLSESVNAFY